MVQLLKRECRQHNTFLGPPCIQGRHLPERLGPGAVEQRRDLQGAHHPGLPPAAEGGFRGDESSRHWMGENSSWTGI